MRHTALSRSALSRRTLLAATLAPVLGLAACSTHRTRTWKIGSGAEGGYFSEFTELLAVTAEATGAAERFAVQASTGSMVNVQGMVTGRFDFGLALSDSLGGYESQLRAVARVYQTYWQLLVPRDSRVTGASDLKGLRVSMGPNGSGTQFTAHRLLAKAGLSGGDYREVPMSVSDSGRALMAGSLDAILVAGGVPLPAVEAAVGSAARLISLERETAALIAEYGQGYVPVLIPAGVYGSAEPTPSLGVSSLLVCAPSVPADAVGNVVRLLVEYPDRLVPESTVGTQYLDPRSMIYTGALALHPGAQQVFRQLHG